MTLLDDRPVAAARPLAVEVDTLRLNAAQRRLAAAVSELLQPRRVGDSPARNSAKSPRGCEGEQHEREKRY